MVLGERGSNYPTKAEAEEVGALPSEMREELQNLRVEETGNVSRERSGGQAVAPIVVNQDCGGGRGGSEAGCKRKESNSRCTCTMDENDVSRRFRS